MKRVLIMVTVLITLMVLPFPVQATALTVAGKSSLLMDVATGTVLFEQNSHEALAPASVTKVMTMLLVVEAVESGALSLDDVLTVSTRALPISAATTRAVLLVPPVPRISTFLP